MSIPVRRISEETLLAAGLTPIDLIAKDLDGVREELLDTTGIARRHGESLLQRRLTTFVKELDDFRAVLAERRSV